MVYGNNYKIKDFVWICYWGILWSKDTQIDYYAKGIDTFVLVLSIVNLFLKVNNLFKDNMHILWMVLRCRSKR